MVSAYPRRRPAFLSTQRLFAVAILLVIAGCRGKVRPPDPTASPAAMRASDGKPGSPQFNVWVLWRVKVVERWWGSWQYSVTTDDGLSWRLQFFYKDFDATVLGGDSGLVYGRVINRNELDYCEWRKTSPPTPFTELQP